MDGQPNPPRRRPDPIPRELTRACDTCRKRKAKCDGPQQTNRICSACKKTKTSCSYSGQTERKEVRKSYVQELERRLEQTEALLRKHCPNVDVAQELAQLELEDRTKSTVDLDAHPLPRKQRSKQHNAALPADLPPNPGATPALPPEDLPPSDDEKVVVPLAERRPECYGLPETFVGKSSPLVLFQHALHVRLGTKGPRFFMKNPERRRRPEFWKNPGFEFREEHVVNIAAFQSRALALLPPPELLNGLIDAYFADYNLYLPLLHRPLFLAQLQAGVHHSDAQFLAVVLLVCAVGSRSLCNDPRVQVEPGDVRSAGWCYFDASEPMNRVRLATVIKIYDLQLKVLAAMFLWGSSMPDGGWSHIGAAVRAAQEVGIHRNKVYSATPNLTDELWKRAFWCIVYFDRWTSSCFGRPVAIQDEGYDVELPLEVDDDCWDISSFGDPSVPQSFPLKHEQPKSRPCTISYFAATMKLGGMLGFAIRTVFSINKAKARMGYSGVAWEQRIVADIDKSLVEWTAALPDHLKWDPTRVDTQENWVTRQQLTLWISFSSLQAYVHRLFIRLPARSSPASPTSASNVPATDSSASIASTPPLAPLPAFTLRSLTICNAAARNVITLTEAYFARTPPPHDSQLTYHTATSILTSSVLLLTAILAANLGSTQAEFGACVEEREAYVAGLMKDVRRALNVLKYAEKWWIPAGKMWDALNEITNMGPGDGTDINPTDDTSHQPDFGAWGTNHNGDQSLRPLSQGPLMLNPFGPTPSAVPAEAAQTATAGLESSAMATGVQAADLNWQTLADWSTFEPLTVDAPTDGIGLSLFGSHDPLGDPLRWLGLNAYSHSMLGSGELATTLPGEQQSNVETDWWPI